MIVNDDQTQQIMKEDTLIGHLGTETAHFDDV